VTSPGPGYQAFFQAPAQVSANLLVFEYFVNFSFDCGQKISPPDSAVRI